MEMDQAVGKVTRVYKLAGTLPIKVDVHLPDPVPGATEDEERLRPAVLFFHGGGLVWGMRNRVLDEYVERFVKAGIVLVSADYRLAPESKLPAIAEDVEDALAWVRGLGAAEFSIDPARVAAMGWSAGAYLALLSGTLPEPPRAVISIAGYGDILGDWCTRPSQAYLGRELVDENDARQYIRHEPLSEGPDSRFPFYLWCRQQGRWVEEITGLNPRTKRTELLRYCPVHNVGDSYPATILLHGDSDTDVPVDQSIQMAAALQNAARPHQLVIVEGGGHGFDFETQLPEVRDALERMVRFLEEWVQ
jgi:acetyl esterase/lipase